MRQALPADGPPVIGIGGITVANVAEVAGAGADGICVMGAITLAEDPQRVAAELMAAFQRGRA